RALLAKKRAASVIVKFFSLDWRGAVQASLQLLRDRMRGNRKEVGAGGPRAQIAVVPQADAVVRAHRAVARTETRQSLENSFKVFGIVAEVVARAAWRLRSFVAHRHLIWRLGDESPGRDLSTATNGQGFPNALR